ncbi:ArnT family glycosyltransferase [Neolewinella antarctica]|uniref:4-amino-4-deoxy-L-arabinose transferase-like glycosyltransferase n=1 Tax=Neolewinella antarctica TaxID=442734 RepID=A0ABX0X991_9BACT|nr:glycosyltransferase family 39 protein [Neolewinella antarctica]NJC25825.1 4-amino-4-deoxy-L-arabinose transferase-like glycosyltransferase [Neolewinella antarctica]
MARFLPLAIILLFGTCFFGTNNLQLFDWDELNFAEISREMLVTDNWVQPTVNYLPFHEKPPLFSWMQLLSYKIFGVSPRGARFPNLVCGIVTFLLLLQLGKKSFGGNDRRWWPLFLGLSVLPALYAQSGIIDPWFNLFTLAGLWWSLTGAALTARQVLLSGLVLGLAVLTKGPAAGLIAGLCWLVLLLVNPAHRGRRAARYLAIGLLSLLPIGIWLVFLWQEDGGYFAREFLRYQARLFFREDAGHGGFPGYHVVVLLLGCFPASWLALPALFNRRRFSDPTDRGMRVLFWVVLVLFSVVNTKIVHYSSLCYFPLCWFAARTLTGGEAHLSPRWRRVVRTGLLSSWILYTLLLLAVPLLAITAAYWLPLVDDAEVTARLAMLVTWPWYTFVPGVVGIAGIVFQTNAALLRTNPASTTAQNQLKNRAATYLLFTGLLTLTTLCTIVPRVQQYTQGAPVAFFKELRGRDVYVGTAYYKSYAHWYYADLPPERYADGCRERQCRFHENISKPLYFASPARVTEQVLREVPDAVLLRQAGGFSFYVREVKR